MLRQGSIQVKANHRRADNPAELHGIANLAAAFCDLSAFCQIGSEVTFVIKS
jgi:hypothetical protein